MCALFGIVGTYEPAQARQALSLMAHRGPDACGIIERPELFFAHSRLGIRDLTPQADQPMAAGGLLLAFNGEVYNWREVADALGSPHTTEAETVLAAWKRWGAACVRRFRGMFAMAVYEHGTLYLLRDRLGKKPLFFTALGRRFVFASELKAIVPFLPKVVMNDDALMGYLSFLAPTAPHTFFKGIEKLAPGEMLTLSNGGVKRERYYDLLDAAEPLDAAEAEKTIEALLYESVRLRLDADVPVCALLSGGIDSAAVNAVAARLGRPLPTFTLGYKGFANYDESGAAAETAALLGLEHTRVVIDRNDFVDHLDPVLDHLDEPLNDPAAVPLYLLYERIKREGYRVVLSGEGGDELFLGYRQYLDYFDV